MAGDDGSLATAALATEPDGVIIGTLGAGHLGPPLLDFVGAGRRAHPDRGLLPPRARGRAQDTYGYPGSERDLRGTGIIPAASSPPRRRG